MFVARACLDMLIRSEDLSKTDYILSQFKAHSGPSPLLHAIEFIIEGLRTNDFEFIKKIAMIDYAPAFKRDSQLIDKIDTICQKYLNGQTIKPVNPMQAMMANMFGMGKK